MTEVADLGGGEQRRGRIRARGYARPAADTGCSIHRCVRRGLWNQDRIRILSSSGGRADESSRLDDAVERTAVDDEVLDHGKSPGPPGFYFDNLAVPEASHVKLARRRSLH